MQLNPNGGLTSVLATLLSKGSVASVGGARTPASQFEQILAQLSSVLGKPGRGEFNLPLLPVSPASGGQARDPGAVDGGEMLESLKTLREHLEAALQELQAEAAGAGQKPPEVSGGLAQPESPEAENGRELLESLKTLRAHLKAALRSAAGQTQPTGEAGGEEESSALRLIEALSRWIGQHLPENTAQEAAKSPGTDASIAEEFIPVGRRLRAMMAQVAEDAGGVLSAGETQFSPSLPDSAPPLFEAVPVNDESVRNELGQPSGWPQGGELQGWGEQTDDSNQDIQVMRTSQDIQVMLTSKEQKPVAAPLVVSQFGDAGTEAVVPRSGDVGIPVEAGPVSNSAFAAFAGGSPDPALPVGELGPDSTGRGAEVLPSSTPGRVTGSSPAFPPDPQSGDRVGLELKSPLTSPEWADEFGQRLIWMHGRSIQAAEIHVNPPELGPVAVRIRMHEDQTSIQFASPHAAVREAIEAALPRLRELFEARQLSLAQVEVAQQSLEDRSHSHARQESRLPRDYRAHTREEGAEESGQEYEGSKANIGSRLLSLYV